MGSVRTVERPRKRTRGQPRRWAPALPLVALPCPAVNSSTPRGPHGHRCTTCGDTYRCPGPDDTGFCAPVCAPCYWVELGAQLRVYRAVVAALARKRRAMERAAGRAACLAAGRERRRRRHAGQLVVGFGRVVSRATGGTRAQEKDCEPSPQSAAAGR
jgi:hypothetical protein